MKVKKVLSGIANTIASNVVIGYSFECPGCGHSHLIYTDGRFSNGVAWDFNGDQDRPTFQPSLLTWIDEPPKAAFRCHSFIRDGNIQFLADCSHPLANQTVPLPEIEINHEQN
jgi:hypothetical protein